MRTIDNRFLEVFQRRAVYAGPRCILVAVSPKFLGEPVDPYVSERPETYLDMILELDEQKTDLNAFDSHGKRDKPFDVGFCGPRLMKEVPVDGYDGDTAIVERLKRRQCFAKENDPVQRRLIVDLAVGLDGVDPAVEKFRDDPMKFTVGLGKIGRAS